jgi:hypothetical protein
VWRKDGQDEQCLTRWFIGCAQGVDKEGLEDTGQRDDGDHGLSADDAALGVGTLDVGRSALDTSLHKNAVDRPQEDSTDEAVTLSQSPPSSSPTQCLPSTGTVQHFADQAQLVPPQLHFASCDDSEVNTDQRVCPHQVGCKHSRLFAKHTVICVISTATTITSPLGAHRVANERISGPWL